jgi:hypothetical protein
MTEDRSGNYVTENVFQTVLDGLEKAQSVGAAMGFNIISVFVHVWCI